MKSSHMEKHEVTEDGGLTETPIDTKVFQSTSVEGKNLTPEPLASTANYGQEGTGVYKGELLGLQLGAFMKWKETDDYKRAYFQKQKKRRRKPDWNPQSREFTLWASDSIDWSLENPWFVGPERAKVAQSEYQYKSLEYKRDIEKREASSPQYTAHQNAYKSLEYKRAYPNSSPIAGSTSRSPDVEVEKKDLEISQNSLQAAKEESADWI